MTTTTKTPATPATQPLDKSQSLLAQSVREIAILEKNEAKHGFAAGRLAWEYCQARAHIGKSAISGTLLENYCAAIRGQWCLVHDAPPNPSTLIRAWNAHELFVDDKGDALKLSFTCARDHLSQLICLDTQTSSFTILPEIRAEALTMARSLLGVKLSPPEIQAKIRSLTQLQAQRVADNAAHKQEQAQEKSNTLAQEIEDKKQAIAAGEKERLRLEEQKKTQVSPEEKKKLTEASEKARKQLQADQKALRDKQEAKEQEDREARRAEEDRKRAEAKQQAIADKEAGRKKPTATQPTETVNPQKAIGQAMQRATNKDSAVMLADLLEKTPEPLEVLRELLLEILRRPAFQPLHATARRALTSDAANKPSKKQTADAA